jgi:hypothetical protein
VAIANCPFRIRLELSLRLVATCCFADLESSGERHCADLSVGPLFSAGCRDSSLVLGFEKVVGPAALALPWRAQNTAGAKYRARLGSAVDFCF